MSAFNRAILLLLSLLFLLAGADKIAHYDGFVNALRNYSLVPRGSAPILAPCVILVEVLVGAGLWWRPWRARVLVTAACLLGLFSVALGINLLDGNRGICGCWFTITLGQSTWMHITQNLILAALSLCLLWEETRAASESSARAAST